MQAVLPAHKADAGADHVQHRVHAPLKLRVIPCLLHLQASVLESTVGKQQ